jgi:hypothetical protein
MGVKLGVSHKGKGVQDEDADEGIWAEEDEVTGDYRK